MSRGFVDLKKTFKEFCYLKFKERNRLLAQKKYQVILRRCIFSNKFLSYNGFPRCRRCDKRIKEQDFVIGYTYWKGMLEAYCSASCRDQELSENAYLCQSLDEDCNDCFYFQRGKSIANGVWEGRCKKYQKKTRAYAKMCTGRFCFKHRKYREFKKYD